MERLTKIDELEILRREAENCKNCSLWQQRTNLVFGEGNPNSSIMFIGEAPGFHEDQQGRPFVGAAGRLLTELIESMGLKREDIYIANVLKCRPPNNREPLPEEIKACFPFLRRQIEIINPKVICTLGRYAAYAILGHSVNISNSHGKDYVVDGKRIFVTYHPAAALYHGKLLENIRKDFEKLKELYELTLKSEEEQKETNKKEKEQLSFW
ncbi:uracil-DNA glycosylase [Dictyoglomus thermophilum]|uniref:Type-4 uracil-DNA glycosylase n=2 Tax=Dictyoglomus thermophilum TaxID=14 RepID=B5YEZ9_DICT6|nr:uracil-DNA glycosylase [Dictyoglomus thermophilum]ACI19757.1 DNA polymerase, bacteriophage-type [Dictyoglomus thermophilum H-6-12]MCX7719974.1 uracil-DNA glycosylase [Dictyoglomus thermophilum]TYT22580.1 uracil-DNA glycosylase [Dictyoglomus thermophilum]